MLPVKSAMSEPAEAGTVVALESLNRKFARPESDVGMSLCQVLTMSYRVYGTRRTLH